MKVGTLDEGSVAPSDRPATGTAIVEKERTARVAADGKPLRSERGIREVERNVFRVRVSTGSRDPLTGSPKQVERVIRGGIRAARDLHGKLESEVAKGVHGGSTMTVGELLDDWLGVCKRRVDKAGRAGLEKNTYNNYELQVRTLKATQLASMPLTRLTTRRPVEETYEALGQVLGAARMAQVHKALRAAFNHAMGEGWMTLNPAALVREKPSPPARRRATPTRQQVEAAFVAAQDLHVDLEAFLATAALTGLRRQALCGLRWSDIDFEAGLVSIRRVINVVGGKPVLVDYAKHRRAKPAPPPKHLDQTLVPVLKELRERQRLRAADSGTTYPADGWLFSPDGMGLDHVSPDHFGRLVKQVMRSLDLDATLHSLRHHRGSKLVSEGVDPAIAARELDHGSLSYFLDTYVHPVRSDVDPKLKRVGKSYAIGGKAEAVPRNLSDPHSKDADARRASRPSDSKANAGTARVRRATSVQS
ncbi:MAG: tyrosine-type recombinase/integrase [Acidimicrobiales bacterium]